MGYNEQEHRSLSPPQSKSDSDSNDAAANNTAESRREAGASSQLPNAVSGAEQQKQKEADKDKEKEKEKGKDKQEIKAVGEEEKKEMRSDDEETEGAR